MDNSAHLIDLLYSSGHTDISLPQNPDIDQYLLISPVAHTKDFTIGGNLVVESSKSRTSYLLSLSVGWLEDDMSYSFKELENTAKRHFIKNLTIVTYNGLRYFALEWNPVPDSVPERIYFKGDVFDDSSFLSFVFVSSALVEKTLKPVYDPVKKQNHIKPTSELINLTGTVQLSSGMMSVLALCEIPADTTNSWSSGRIYFQDTAGDSVPMFIDFQANATSSGSVRVLLDSSPNNKTVKGITFRIGETYYGGVELSSEFQYDVVIIDKVGNFEPFGRDFYDQGLGLTTDNELASSIVHIGEEEGLIDLGQKTSVDEELSLFDGKKVEWYKKSEEVGPDGIFTVGDSSDEPFKPGHVYRIVLFGEAEPEQGSRYVLWHDGVAWRNNAVFRKEGHLLSVVDNKLQIKNVSPYNASYIVFVESFGSSTSMLIGPGPYGLESTLETDGEELYITRLDRTLRSLFWNSNNDGAGSGLDADTLHGVDATGYVRLGAEISCSLKEENGQLLANVGGSWVVVWPPQWQP